MRKETSITHDDETLALIASAYEAAAIEADLTADNGLGDEIRTLTPSDAQAALDRMLRRAKNEALEAAHAKIGKLWRMSGSKTETRRNAEHNDAIAKAAGAIRTMKEPEE